MAAAGDVVRHVTCPDPGCNLRVAVRATKRKRWVELYSQCDGRADPSGHGCGCRVFYGRRTSAEWLEDAKGAEVLTQAAADVDKRITAEKRATTRKGGEADAGAGRHADEYQGL